jgi:Type III secretion protein (HpaP)
VVTSNCTRWVEQQSDAYARAWISRNMNQSRSIRFGQIRLVTNVNQPEVLRDSFRLPVSRVRVKHGLPPTPTPAHTDVPPAAAATEEPSVPFDGRPTLHNDNDREIVSGNENRIDEQIPASLSDDTIRTSTENAKPEESVQGPQATDDADQKVGIISAMSVVRTIATDECIRAIAESVARISNDEASDRSGPWHFEMQLATQMLPMTTLSIELSRGEVLLRFLCGERASARLISDRKDDLKSRLVSQLSPPRSVHIEVILE